MAHQPWPVLPRLLEKLRVREDTGCWEWIGSRTIRGGYGQIFALGGLQKTHRLSWTLFRGTIPEGLSVLHKCDNPPCCNPDHLYVGTAKDNARDAVERGQHKSGKCRGTQQPQAKLNDEAVREIRQLRGTLSYQQIANNYGVSKKAIVRVMTGKGWKHVI